MSETTEQDGYEYRVRRQRRSTVTIAVILLTLAGAFYYASSYFSDSAPKPGPCTTEQVAVELKPADVAVNVYNATARKGLALAVSKVVIDRGFRVKVVANDPLAKPIAQVAQIRFGPTGEASAKLLAKHVPGAALVNDKRKGDTIDLSIGNAYKAFGPIPKVATATATLRQCPTVTVGG